MCYATGKLEWTDTGEVVTGVSILTVRMDCLVKKNELDGWDTFIGNELTGNFKSKDEAIKHMQDMHDLSLEEFNKIYGDDSESL